MKMIIERMLIENFKGIRKLDIDFSDKATFVFGMNGTGKTSVADAFSWVLFNKDARGHAPGTKEFRDKPVDDNGNEQHNLDTVVDLRCTLDGARFDLKRMQCENWVKKRGNSAPSYQGNVSTYWINGVETKLQDFKQRISAITSEEVFRLIGSLSAFNALEWKKRREQLLTIAGDDADSTLLARDEYRSVADECGTRNVSVDDLRKIFTDQRKRINDELKMLPVRIDEAKASLPSLTEREIAEAERGVKECNEEIDAVHEMQSTAAGTDEATARSKILALESEIVLLKRRVMDESVQARKALQSDVDAKSTTFTRLSANLSDTKRMLELVQRQIDEAASTRSDLREKFLSVRDAADAVSDTCPICGQSLPADQVEAARSKAADAKKRELEQIQTQGKAVSSQLAQYEEKVKELTEEAKSLQERIRQAVSDRDAAAEKLKSFPQLADFSSEPRIAQLEEQLADAKAALTGGADEAKIRDAMISLETRKRDLQAKLESHLSVLAKRDAGIETRKRISAHEERQRDLGAQLSEADLMIGLIEKFIQDRCSALEDSINAHFPTVRWKLFNQLINGGIEDTCECMIPCDSGLVTYESANTASQINADIEIVNVLSEHYDIQVPLFIDNAERINVIAPTSSQLITLAVSTDSALRIEKQEAV